MQAPRRSSLVEVAEIADTVVVSIKGFLTESERAMTDQPNDRWTIEDYYLRLLDQIAPLMRVRLPGSAGRGLDRFQIVLDVPRDECVFLLTLGREGEVTRVDSP